MLPREHPPSEGSSAAMNLLYSSLVSQIVTGMQWLAAEPHDFWRFLLGMLNACRGVEGGGGEDVGARLGRQALLWQKAVSADVRLVSNFMSAHKAPMKLKYLSTA